MSNKILHLVLKSEWFDKINSGEKTKEYREVKPYWNKRLIGKNYDVVEFRKGYSKFAERLTFKIEYIGQEHYLPNDLNQESVWVIKLGERVENGFLKCDVCGIRNRTVSSDSWNDILGDEVEGLICSECWHKALIYPLEPDNC